MIIKSPACYDISHYKEVPDFKLVEPRPVLFITKATEATSIIDDKFIRFANGMMEIGCCRGFYHFNRKAFDGVKQARYFVYQLQQIDILPTDILILDIEEGGEKASQLWAWHEEVKKAYPDNLRMNYSRANILNPIVMTAAEKIYFKNIFTWTAGYPLFPDLYSTVPKGYIPDQSKYGPAVLWQYSSHGKVNGIIGDADLNWISPSFMPFIEIEIGEKIMASYKGVCETTAKVWATIGGSRVYPDVTVNQGIKADALQTVSGIKYIHLTSPIIGWSKAEWFTYTEVVDNPPPPPTTTKVPFTLNVQGYKSYSGELEKL